MPVAVERHLVPGGDDPPDELRAAAHLLPHDEERRRRSARRERLQHRGRPLGMRSVVECERDARGEPALDVVATGEAVGVRGERERDHEVSASTSDAADGSAASASPGARRPDSASDSACASSGVVRATSAMP